MKKFILSILCMAAASTAAMAQKTGYHGFVEAGYTNTTLLSHYNVSEIEASTTHGLQLSQNLFVGVGVGAKMMGDYESGKLLSTGNKPTIKHESGIEVPVFANLRYNLLKSKFTPFVDVKAGYLVVGSKTPYASGALGLRLAMGENLGIYLAAECSYQSIKFQELDIKAADGNYKDIKETLPGVAVKIGVDF